MAHGEYQPKAKRLCVICDRELNSKQIKTCGRKCHAALMSSYYRGKGKSPYIQIRVNGERVYLHRHIWEIANGRKLMPGEIVHHKDENKRNVDPSNLEALRDRAAHLHRHNYHRQTYARTDRWYDPECPF